MADNAEIISRGQEASLVEAAVGAILTVERSRITNAMIATYRGTVIDKDRLLGLVGEFNALYTLEQSLKAAQRRGTEALRKELTNAAD